MIHELKIYQEYYEDVIIGRKKFELRKNDRDFKVGDFLALKEWLPDMNEYTGREVLVQVTYILEGATAFYFGLKEGYCIMGIEFTV
jgi:ASC-1-like (ASCH) protein